MSCKSPLIVQTKRYSDPRLKAGEDPDLDPATLGVEIPGEENARLHDLEDVGATSHGIVDVFSRLARVELSKAVASCSVRKNDHFLGHPAGGGGAL